MALTSPTSTDIYVLLDESGSMADYTLQIRQCVTTLMEGNFDPKIKYTVITFSENIEHGSNMTRFKPPQHRGTQILPAFKEMHKLVLGRVFPERIIVVFVSDGMDTNLKAPQLTEKLHQLGGLPVHSLLLTIGVGRDFPTGLVVDVLRPHYHMGLASIQSVLPVSSPDDIQWAFGQLEGLILEQLNCKGTSLVPQLVDVSTGNKDLILYIQAKYNECIIKCTATGQTAQQNYTRLFETKNLIAAVSTIAKDRLAKERASEADAKAAGKSEDNIKPLVSNLLRETVYSTKACLTSTLSAITRLNKLLHEAERGKVMSELSDEAKKELLGGHYVEGKLIAVANKYRAANFGTTKNSLLRLLRMYTAKDQDKALDDTINLTSQAEYFEDARENLQDLIPLTHTLPGILKMLSFVCRTVTFKEPLPMDALQMNEWLAEVEALPQVIQRMTTFDFIERHNWNYSSRGEKINGLMVLGGDQTSPGIFHHVQSLLLFRHPGLFCLSARLALAGSVLFYLLGSHEALNHWMHKELQTVQDICREYTRQSLESWHTYVQSVTNPDFRICLLTESPKLPPHCKCPGLTKFILALYAAATGAADTAKHVFSIEELRERHHATVVEFLARTRIAMLTCMDFNDQDKDEKAESFLQKAWTTNVIRDGNPESTSTVGEEILAASLTLQEAKLRFSTMVEMALTDDSLLSKWTSDAKMTARLLKTAKHYQFSIQRINFAFKNLASICGHGDEVSFALSKAGLLRALQTANRLQNGYERFSKPEPTMELTKDEIRSITMRFAKDQLRRAVLANVESMAEQFYLAHHKESHFGLARIIPAQHIQRFKDDFGLDIAKDWAVNDRGLSNNACCSPNCPHYLDLLNHNLAIPSNVICPRLNQHLMTGTVDGPLTAFHKAVSYFPDYSPERVEGIIESGACIVEPHPTKADLEGFKRLEISGASRMLSHKMETLKQEKKTKLIRHVMESCKEIKEAGQDTLKEEIAALQLEISSPTWQYEDFKQVFIAKYKKHARLLGDNPPSHPEWQQQ
jgi:hypothetical protein